ncbi:MAG: DUF1016 domain-containing protein [bacterium]|nr:DUF1016 domain-containing protein [bacterium]
MNKIKSGITVSAKLYENIRRIIEQARKKVYRTVNFAMVEAYWNIGRLIVENEQKGRKRAEYGKVPQRSTNYHPQCCGKN